MNLSQIRALWCAPLLLVCSQSRALLAQASGAERVAVAASLPDAPSLASSGFQGAPSSTPAAPQSSPASPNETDDQRRGRERREEAQREVKAQERQRAVGVLPLFNVVLNGQAVPLRPAQKFDLSFHTIIDPYTVGLAFIVGGGFGELTDSHTGYGHGTAGFFKRVGASYADNVDGNLIGNALLPVILHQDPRYFRKGSGSVKSRILYSALTSFICRGDNGKTQFNTSNVAGNFIAGAISNAYYPADERGVGLTLENGVIVTLEGMVGAQLLEFSPDLNAYLRRRRERRRQVSQEQTGEAATPGASGQEQSAAPAAPSTPKPAPGLSQPRIP